MPTRAAAGPPAASGADSPISWRSSPTRPQAGFSRLAGRTTRSGGSCLVSARRGASARRPPMPTTPSSCHHDLAGGPVLAVLANGCWLPAVGITGTFLLLLFPDGHLLGRRWRYVAWTSAVAMVVGVIGLILNPGPLGDAGYPGVQNPLGVDALGTVLDASWVAIFVVVVMMVASAASLVVRYRRARGPERQQVKWLAAAAAGVAAVYAVVVPVGAIVDPSSQDTPAWLSVAQTASLLSFGLIPVAIVCRGAPLSALRDRRDHPPHAGLRVPGRGAGGRLPRRRGGRRRPAPAAHRRLGRARRDALDAGRRGCVPAVAARGSSGPSTTGSIAPGTTRPARSRRSAAGCASRSTSRRCRPS